MDVGVASTACPPPGHVMFSGFPTGLLAVLMPPIDISSSTNEYGSTGVSHLIATCRQPIIVGENSLVFKKIFPISPARSCVSLLSIDPPIAPNRRRSRDEITGHEIATPLFPAVARNLRTRVYTKYGEIWSVAQKEEILFIGVWWSSRPIIFRLDSLDLGLSWLR